jgi:hypothetical protein
MLNTAGFAPGILSFVLPKLGVVALLCRLFNPNRWWKIFLWTLVSGAGLVICGCIIIIYAQCTPTKALWTPGLGECWNPTILVDYSIFAGGTYSRMPFNSRLIPGSAVCIFGHFPSRFSRADIMEVAIANKKKSRTLSCICSRSLVSIL